VPDIWGRMYVMVFGVQKVKKRDEKLDSCTAEKGAKKLVSSNFAKILEKESSDKD
jgi:hypothetical protein